MQPRYAWLLIFFLSVNTDTAGIRLPNDIFSHGGSTRFMKWVGEGSGGGQQANEMVSGDQSLHCPLVQARDMNFLGQDIL